MPTSPGQGNKVKMCVPPIYTDQTLHSINVILGELMLNSHLPFLPLSPHPSSSLSPIRNVESPGTFQFPKPYHSLHNWNWSAMLFMLRLEITFSMYTVHVFIAFMIFSSFAISTDLANLVRVVHIVEEKFPEPIWIINHTNYDVKLVKKWVSCLSIQFYRCVYECVQ